MSNIVIDLTKSFTSNDDVVIDLVTNDDADYFRNSHRAIVLGNITDENLTKFDKKKSFNGKNVKAMKKSKLHKDLDDKKLERRTTLSDCAICFEELGLNPLAATKCGHVFCMKCLERSLKYEKKCPTCRRDLKSTSSYHPLYI